MWTIFVVFWAPLPYLFGQSGASHNSPSEAHQSSGTLNRYGISANTMPICQLPIAEKAKKNDITRELLWLSSNRLSRPHGKGIANVTVLVFTHYRQSNQYTTPPFPSLPFTIFPELLLRSPPPSHSFANYKPQPLSLSLSLSLVFMFV